MDSVSRKRRRLADVFPDLVAKACPPCSPPAPHASQAASPHPATPNPGSNTPPPADADDADEAAWAAMPLPSDAMAAVLLLRREFQQAAAASGGRVAVSRPLLVQAHVHTVLSERTQADQGVDELRRANAVRMFKLPTGADEHVIMLTEDYVAMLEQHAARQAESAGAREGEAVEREAAGAGSSGEASTSSQRAAPSVFLRFAHYVLPRCTDVSISKARLLQLLADGLPPGAHPASSQPGAASLPSPHPSSPMPLPTQASPRPGSHSHPLKRTGARSGTVSTPQAAAPAPATPGSRPAAPAAGPASPASCRPVAGPAVAKAIMSLLAEAAGSPRAGSTGPGHTGTGRGRGGERAQQACAARGGCQRPAGMGARGGRLAARVSASDEAAVSTLLTSGFLTRHPLDDAAFFFCIPDVGQVVKSIEGGRKELLGLLRRRKYGEAKEAEVLKKVKLRFSALGTAWHVRDLLGRGQVKRLDTTTGHVLKVVNQAKHL